jgi:hypothetical protein
MIIGLMGKTNTGKSSFFKAATMIDVEIADRPFVTINPNIGIAYVIIDCACKEFNVDCKPKSGMCKNGKRFIPVKLVDVAGLVPGAHTGKGLGNKFLDDLRQSSVLIQVIDTSGLTDEEGKPTTNYDPNFDVEFVEKEIDLWFASVVQRAVEKFGKKLVISSKADLVQILTEQLSGLEIEKKHIQEIVEKIPISNVENFARELRKISKPIIIAANKIDLGSAQENFEKLKQKYSNIVPTSAEAELALKKAAEKGLIDYLPGNDFEMKGNLDEKQKKVLEFIKQNVIGKFGSTGIQICLNKAVFDTLNYIAVYPVENENKLTDGSGNVLPDVYLLPKGSTALDLAFKIHTDIGEKFISAIDARTKKRLGKEYQLKDKDVIKIAVAR